MKITRRHIASTINSFNNAAFTKVTSLRDGDRLNVFFHFVASNFAVEGIKRYFGADAVVTASPAGAYYVDYTALKYAERVKHNQTELIKQLLSN